MVDPTPLRPTTHGREPFAPEPEVPKWWTSDAGRKPEPEPRYGLRSDPSGPVITTENPPENPNIEIQVDHITPDPNKPTLVDVARERGWWKRAFHYQLHQPAPEDTARHVIPGTRPPAHAESPEHTCDRLDMLHHVYHNLTHNRHVLAPVNPKGKRILRLSGTTGIWPIHFGADFPQAERVVGVHDTYPQPWPDWKPDNVQFYEAHVEGGYEEDWKEYDGSGDVKHAGGWDLVHCGPAAGDVVDWPELVLRSFNCLLPGGWAEFREEGVEVFSEDATIPEDDLVVAQMKALVDAGREAERPVDPAPNLEGWLRGAGFINVRVKKFKMPIGEWPRDRRMKEIGALKALNFMEIAAAFSAMRVAELGLRWTSKEVDELNDRTRATVEDRDVHRLQEFYVVTGQKPG